MPGLPIGTVILLFTDIEGFVPIVRISLGSSAAGAGRTAGSRESNLHSQSRSRACEAAWCDLRDLDMSTPFVGRMRQVAAAMVVWLAVLAVSAAGVELYARRNQGYALWTWSLQQRYFSELDRLKTFNRHFYEEKRAHFRWWPVPVELLDTAAPAPRYLYKPNLRLAWAGNRLVPAQTADEVQWSTNSWGFRGPEFSVRKPQGLIRIVCLGGSVTEGGTDRESYPYYLQQELHRLFPRQAIEVINAGHHEYGLDDLLALLETRVLSLDPDIVIFNEAATSINFPEFLAGRPSCGLGSCWLDNYPRWYGWLYGHSAAFGLLSDGLGWSSRIPPPRPHVFDERPPKASAVRYRALVEQIVRETLAHKSRIVLSSFVTVARQGIAVSYAEDPGLFNDLYKKWYPLTPGELGRIYAYFNRQVAEVAAEFNVPYADVAAMFPQEIRYFPFDIVHLNPEGNRLLAQAFAEFLAREVLPGIMKESSGHTGRPRGYLLQARN